MTMKCGWVTLLLLGSGCMQPGRPSVGWSVQVGRPPAVFAPALVTQTTGAYTLMPVGAVANTHAEIGVGAEACDTRAAMEELHRRLETVERRTSGMLERIPRAPSPVSP